MNHRHRCSGYTKKAFVAPLSPSVGNRSSDTQRVFLTGLAWLWLASFLRSSLPFRGFSLPQTADRARRNRNESHENHALRINLSLLACLLLLSRVWDDVLVAFFFAQKSIATKLLSAHGLLAISPTGKPDIDQEQKREAGSLFGSFGCMFVLV